MSTKRGDVTILDMDDHRDGEGPVRFGLPKWDAAKTVDTTAFSDHFPVSVIVDEADQCQATPEIISTRDE